MTTLIDKIELEMRLDEEDREEQSKQLEYAYTHSSEETQKAIDTCFIALCGWSLKTLLTKDVR